MTNVTKNKSKTLYEMRMHTGMNSWQTAKTSKKNYTRKSSPGRRRIKKPSPSLRETAELTQTIYNSENSSKERDTPPTRELTNPRTTLKN